jgi:hypothetical protein
MLCEKAAWDALECAEFAAADANATAEARHQ